MNDLAKKSKERVVTVYGMINLRPGENFQEDARAAAKRLEHFSAGDERDRVVAQ